MKRRINIPLEIGTMYPQFGVFLLDDITGDRLRNIEHKCRGDIEKINTEILWEWINERGKLPVIWETLTEVLHAIKLHNLASEIEVVKLYFV